MLWRRDLFRRQAHPQGRPVCIAGIARAESGEFSVGGGKNYLMKRILVLTGAVINQLQNRPPMIC